MPLISQCIQCTCICACAHNHGSSRCHFARRPPPPDSSSLACARALVTDTSELRLYFEQRDHNGRGAVSTSEWGNGLRTIVRGGSALPWEDYVAHLANPQPDGSISYRAFLNRYRVSPGAAATWQSNILSALYEQLSKLNLTETVALLDENKDVRVLCCCCVPCCCCVSCA